MCDWRAMQCEKFAQDLKSNCASKMQTLAVHMGNQVLYHYTTGPQLVIQILSTLERPLKLNLILLWDSVK